MCCAVEWILGHHNSWEKHMRTPCDACYVQAIPTDEEMEKLSNKWRPYRSLGGAPDTPGAINGIEP